MAVREPPLVVVPPYQMIVVAPARTIVLKIAAIERIPPNASMSSVNRVSGPAVRVVDPND
jgi:hypothetical protein